MNLAKNKIERLIDENSKSSRDQVEYAKNYSKLVDVFNKEKEFRKLKCDFFIKKLNTLEPITEFDPILWNLMLDKMVVYENGSFEFVYEKGI